MTELNLHQQHPDTIGEVPDSVSENTDKRGPLYLPPEDVNTGYEALIKAESICYIVGALEAGALNEIPAEYLCNAMWAVRGMINVAKDVIEMRRPVR